MGLEKAHTKQFGARLEKAISTPLQLNKRKTRGRIIPIRRIGLAHYD
jgi:hypothetical protein